MGARLRRVRLLLLTNVLVSVLSGTILRHAEAPASDSVKKAEDDEDAPVLLPLIESVKCLAAAWSGSGKDVASAEASMAAHSGAVGQCLAGHNPWPVRVAALAAAQSFVERLVLLNNGGIPADGNSGGDTAMESVSVLEKTQTPWVDSMIPGVLDCTKVVCGLLKFVKLQPDCLPVS